MVRGLYQRGRRVAADPRVDVAIALVAVAATEVELAGQYRHLSTGVRVGLGLVGVLIGAPLGWRRRAPLIALGGVLAGVVGAELLVAISTVRPPAGQGPLTPFLAVLLAAFSFTAYTQRRRMPTGVLVLGAALAGSLAAHYLSVSRSGFDVGFWVATLLFLGVGLLFRQRLLRVAELQVRTEQLEQQQAERARTMIIEERARIARELHDVVGHSVSVMVVQAGAARHTLGTDPAEVRAALQSIETAGREALVELRRLLGILRESTDTPTLAPVPGLAQLPALIAQFREAGLPTDLALSGTPDSLSTGMDLTIYRIVQEALTNSLKHAGPAHARVRIDFLPHEVAVTVTDDGAGSRAKINGAGHGLVGMRERVALYNGQLTTGWQGSGYAVEARLPLDGVGG